MKLLFSILSFVLATPVFAADKTVTVEVGTMACGVDPHNIKNSLAAVLGVKNVQVSLPDKTATVTFDDSKSDENALLVAIAGAGYAGLLKSK